MPDPERRSSTLGRYPSLSLREVKRIKLHVLGWGRGDLGQLGNHSEDNVLVPTRIEAFDGKDLVHLAGNLYNSGGVTDDGEVYMMGSNDQGQLGNKERTTRLTPERVNTLDLYRVVHLALGQQHSLALTEEGRLVSWGDAEYGQLGHGTTAVEHPIPKLAKADEGVHFVRCAAGKNHSVTMSSNGQVFACGEGAYGALGCGDLLSSGMLRKVPDLFSVGVVQIACGEHNTMALSIDGRLFSWGRGKYGQLGLGDTNNAQTPRLVDMNGARGRQVACGADHALMISHQGELFSWGRGTWGQTGTTTTENQLIPVKVLELEHEYIVQVSAGRGHSLAMARRGALFAFGNGEQGQLGLGIVTNESSPMEVSGLPQLPLLYVLAAGDHSFAVYEDAQNSDGKVSLESVIDPKHGMGLRALTLPTFSLLLEAVKKSNGEDEDSVVSLEAAIEDVFTSPGYCIKQFSMPGKAPDPSSLHLHMPTITRTYEELLRLYNPSIVTRLGLAVLGAMDEMLSSLQACENDQNRRAEAASGWLRCLIIFWLNPLLGEAQGQGMKQVEKLADIIACLAPSSVQLLEKWLGSLRPDLLGGRIVGGVQKCISNLTSSYDAETNPTPLSIRQKLLKISYLLGAVYKANLAAGEPVPFARFGNKRLGKALSWRQEYFHWRSRSSEARIAYGLHSSPIVLYSFCEIPCVLTPETKSKIIQSEAFFQKHQQVQESHMQAFMEGIPPALVTFLEIHVRRDHIVKDTLNQIRLRPHDLKKPLRVTFISNDVNEEGQDGGGLSKEFFQLLVQEIFCEDYGMFVYDDATRTFWFNSLSLEPSENFQLCGIILGLAIYNNVILDVHFPIAVYKLLLGLELDYHDLEALMPDLAKGLQQMLDFEGDVESVFCTAFEVEYDFFGELRNYELKPDGKNIPVTNSNRDEYVKLYSKYTLTDSVSDQATPFVDGFRKMCDGPALVLFRFEELELLVCGLPHFDFSSLKSGAKYDGGYHAGHNVVQWFWEVLDEMPLVKKKQFLAFTTGCDRAPVGGLSELTLTIQKSGPDSQRLPSAHTCFNTLLLPEYTTKSKLSEKLMLAMENAIGFGLQ